MQTFAPGEWAGQVSDRYALDHVVGSGGMGEVWAGWDVVLNRAVAVKVMHEHLARDVVAQGRFQREARAAASLNHPGIAAVYDAGMLPSTSSRPYLVMEYVEGQTLADVLRLRIPAVEDALHWVALVLEALEYAHAAGLVHRDIKPANVMITASGHVKVMDFGIARMVQSTETGLTSAHEVIGTVAYMSPEQVQGLAADPRSDLYSTGCLLYELLTGRQPHVGETPVAVAYRHVHEEPRPPSRLRSELPPQIDAIVLRALAKEPCDRFTSAAEMRAALSGQPHTEVAPVSVSAPRDTVVTKLMPAADSTNPGEHPWKSPRPLRLAGTAFAVIAAMTALVAASLTYRRADAPSPGAASGPSAPSASPTAAAPPSASGSTGTTNRASTSSASPTGAASPSASGSMARARSTPSATVTASGSPSSTLVTMPDDLVGRSLGDARRELTQLGLHVGLAPGSASSADAIVVTTLPSAGTQVARGDTVILATIPTTSTPEVTATPSTSPSAPTTPTATASASSPKPQTLPPSIG